MSDKRSTLPRAACGDIVQWYDSFGNRRTGTVVEADIEAIHIKHLHGGEWFIARVRRVDAEAVTFAELVRRMEAGN
jgi:hypothetical protein